MDFLEKLDYLMEINHLNKSSLSKACDIPYTTIDGWYKKGYEGLKLSTLRKLANYFGTSLDYWATENNPDIASLPKEFLETFSSLLPETQNYLLHIAEELLQTQEKLLEHSQEQKLSDSTEQLQLGEGQEAGDAADQGEDQQ